MIFLLNRKGREEGARFAKFYCSGLNKILESSPSEIITNWGLRIDCHHYKQLKPVAEAFEAQGRRSMMVAFDRVPETITST